MVITLSVEKFREMFPEFSNLTDGQIELVIGMADMYLDNTVRSCVMDDKKREMLLYLICAHLCYLRFGDNKGNGGSGIIGRISSASEGSVSVSSDMGSTPFRYSWYAQSPYGMDFWQATKSCRGFRYYTGKGVYHG